MKDQPSNSSKIAEAISAIKADLPSEAEIASASERARAAIAMQKGTGTGAIQASESPLQNDSWDSMDDYVSAIPAYLAQQLSPAQTLLFEEESRRSIPLRRALESARQRESSLTAEQISNTPARSINYRWLATAATFAMIAIALFIAVPELPSFNQSRLAQVEQIDGQLYQLANGRLETLTPGTWIDGRQRIRSASGSTAMLTLDDGSQIEVDERSELSMTRRGSGNRIDVTRGRILVAASPQGSGTLDVFTNEFMVSVTGTIFEVAHGAKGSMVAVIEGEVDVHLQGDTTSLTPGEVMASRMEFLALNIEDEIIWSQDAALYIDMLQEVAALQQDLEAVMATPPRYSTRLLDLAPADTAVYIAVPNAPEKVADVYEVIRARMQDSQFLGEAWTNFQAATEGQYVDETMAWLREIGYTLGEETVVAVTMQSSSNENDNRVAVPVVLSEVDADAFRASFEDQIQRLQDVLEAEGQDSEFEIAIIEDSADATDGQLSILLYEDILIASIDAATLQEMQDALDKQGSGFVGTDLHTQLQTSYNQGTEVLGAVHIPKLLSPIEMLEPGFNEVGLANVEYLIAQYGQRNGSTNITADLFFDGVREGVMSWLATPGTMGSLEFFSVDATIAAAFLIKEPNAILEEFDPIVLPQELDAAAELELFYNVVSILGGELALGLDGPALPTPAWKAVVEAYDSSLLQESIEWSVTRFNDYAVANGISAAIALSSADVAGYSGYQVSLSVEPSAAMGTLSSASFHYAFVDGYLVAAPNQALVDRAISFYESGSGLQTDSEFRELLARDGYLDFSAVYFSRLGELINDVMQNLPSSLSAEQQSAISALDTDIGPSMTSLLALPDKIHFAHSGSSQLPLQVLSQLVALQPLIESMADQVQVQ